MREAIGGDQAALVLFCGDPLRWSGGGAVDPEYAPEAVAAEGSGFEVALLDFEALVDGGDALRAIRRVPVAASASSDALRPALYRGWMLRPRDYARLYEALEGRGVRLLTDPAAYQHCHYLPEWYPLLEGHTPRSVWLPLSEAERQPVPLGRVMQALAPFGDAPLIVKDYVKSRKHEWTEACYIPRASDADAVERVVSRFAERQGPDLNEGLVFREYVPLKSLGVHARTGMPLSVEWRVFFFDGEPVWGGAYWEGVVNRSAHPPKEEVRRLAAPIRSRFFTMDVAELPDGSWTVIELGDGQVSALPNVAEPWRSVDSEEIYVNLAARFTVGG
jgi:hypothetical protein